MEKKSTKKRLQGKVVSNKMDKTIIVLIETMTMHSLYKKYVKHSRRVKSHDAENTCSIGDTVLIEETRPLSKGKRYRLVEIVEKVK